VLKIAGLLSLGPAHLLDSTRGLLQLEDILPHGRSNHSTDEQRDDGWSCLAECGVIMDGHDQGVAKALDQVYEVPVKRMNARQRPIT